MIDIAKKYKTRDGRDVRIYAVDGDSEFPVHGAIQGPRDWWLIRWSADGRFSGHTPNPSDLVEIKPKITRWIVAHDMTGFATLEEARIAAERYVASGSSVAVVPVTFRPGDGL